MFNQNDSVMVLVVKESLNLSNAKIQGKAAIASQHFLLKNKSTNLNKYHKSNFDNWVSLSFKKIILKVSDDVFLSLYNLSNEKFVIHSGSDIECFATFPDMIKNQPAQIIELIKEQVNAVE